MYKDVLRSIVGIEVFPVLSLVIFLAVFVVMLVRVFGMDGARLAVLAGIPLDDAAHTVGAPPRGIEQAHTVGAPPRGARPARAAGGQL